MRKEYRTIVLQAGLFIVTFITTTLAGAELVYSKFVLTNSGWNDQYTWNDFVSGMEFSIPFLLILTVHEFGHYFTAMAHKVKASLPYYIPFPPAIFSPTIGTLGAVIRIREKVRSNVQHFDIGLAGPLAGFIVALLVIAYGFMTLPPADYIFKFHPEYEAFGSNYAEHVYSDEYLKDKRILDIEIGTNLLFELFESFVAEKDRLPNPHEMMHYPVLLAGFIALFFTSMNLLPIGQLDGGHVTYGLFGWRRHRLIATVFFILWIFYSGLGAVNVHEHTWRNLAWMIPLAVGIYYIFFSSLGFLKRDRIMTALLVFAVQFVISWLFPSVKGYTGWMFFAFLVSRLAGIQHPPSEIEIPLDSKRIILGWIALIIFVLCFSPFPIEAAIKGGAQ